MPSREGQRYIFSRNDGLQNQAVIYKAAELGATPDVLLDPNALSEDGTVALNGLDVQRRRLAWPHTPFRRPAPTGSSGACATSPPDGTCSDVIKWSKFSGASWLKDGSGFFYSRYAAPAEGQAFSGVNKHQQVFFHALGTPQEQDTLVFARDDQPDWGFNADVTEDGRFLTVVQWEGTNRENRHLRPRPDEAGIDAIEPFLDKFDASYHVVGNDGDRFYVLTDRRRESPPAGRDRSQATPILRRGRRSFREPEARCPGRRDDDRRAVHRAGADRRP